MRSIPASLAAKVRDLDQTAGNNNAPHLQAIITRHRVLLTDFDMWQRSVIPGINPTRTSVAASRPSALRGPDAVYVGAVQDGVGYVYRGALSGVTPPSAWTLWATIPDAIAIAVAFDGHFAKRLDKVQFVTDGDPWIFFIKANGDVYGQISGLSTQLGTDAVSISATMGAASIMGDVSEGLILAMATTDGAVITRQYLDGVWEDGIVCSDAPDNVTGLTLSRTWDYRVVLQCACSDGKVWQMLGASTISGNANTEQVEISSLTLSTEILPTIQNNLQAADENIEASVDLTSGIWTIIAPTLLSAVNINDGTGNWGVKLRLIYSGPVYDLAGNAGQFSLSAGGTFAGEALGYDPADPTGATLLLSVTDFNNGTADATLSYTQGTLASGPGLTLLANASVSFTATGLVPTSPPAVVSIAAIDSTTIDILFDSPLSSTNIGANSAAFTVTGFEPGYSPGGALGATTYVINSITFKDATNSTVRLTLTYAGRLKHPQGNVTVAYAASSGNLHNAAGSLTISSFNRTFDPDEAALTLFFNPADNENISATVVVTTEMYQVVPVSAKAGDESIQASVAVTTHIYDTNSNEV